VTWYNDRGENPSEIVLQCEALPHGSSTPITLEAAADLGFETPTPQLNVSYNAVFLSTNYLSSNCQPGSPPEIAITMGMQCISASPGPGISWRYNIVANDQSEQSGHIALWQIVGNFHQDLVTNGVDNIYAKSNCGDGNIPLTSGLSGMAGGVQNWNATWHDVDAPASGTLGNDMSYAELDASFDDYLMYKPPDETYNFKPSIWISLGHFNWSFTANSTNANGWSQPATTYSTPGPAPSLDTAIPVPSFPNNC
jgi:hypothetical protein